MSKTVQNQGLSKTVAGCWYLNQFENIRHITTKQFFSISMVDALFQAKKPSHSKGTIEKLFFLRGASYGVELLTFRFWVEPVCFPTRQQQVKALPF